MSDVLNHVSNKDVKKYLQEIRKEGYTFSITGGTHVRIECKEQPNMTSTIEQHKAALAELALAVELLNGIDAETDPIDADR